MSDSPDPHAAPHDSSAQALATTDDAAPPTHYDPADYRWVPVRRVPRLDGWTEEKQRRFIETLADTGQVALAAKAVGLSRAAAYKLRRAPHGAAFARAWDAARHHAGAFLEDVAFERAIEGVEHNVYNDFGEVVCTKRVHNDRLLMFLLRHLKPERYAREALVRPASPEPLEASLRRMEPVLPAPATELLDPETLEDELELADVAEGTLPHFLTEQHAAKTATREAVEAHMTREQRGRAASEKMERGEGPLSREEFADMCYSIEPPGPPGQARGRHR